MTRGCSSWPSNELLWNPGVWCSMLKIEQHMIWLFYLLALMLSRLEMLQSEELISLEKRWNAQHSEALQHRPGWDGTADLWILGELVAQLSCNNWELVVIGTARVGNYLETLLAGSSSWQESIAWSCWVIVYSIYTLWRMEKYVEQISGTNLIIINAQPCTPQSLPCSISYPARPLYLRLPLPCLNS